MPTAAPVTPELFNFFRELAANNTRPWFEANKSRYEAHVRQPLLGFIANFGLRLAEISPHYLADARPSGGSMFRIYRDIRFSADKTPFKTAAGIQFRHESGKDVHAPGFYLHLEPGNVFVGMGLWHPDNSTLTKIRDAMVDQPARWQQITHNIGETFTMQGDSLVRPPKGYDPAHPLITDLKRKDFIIGLGLTEAEAVEPNFIDRFADLCRAGSPYVEFLTTAVGLPW